MLSLQPTATTTTANILSTDIVGPLHKSTSEYAYIFLILDCSSKYVFLFPIRSANATSIVRIMMDNVFLVFGAPKRIITDNRVQFKEKDFKAILLKYDVNASHLSIYQPQANSVIKTMLTAYVSENHRFWDRYLVKVTLCDTLCQI